MDCLFVIQGEGRGHLMQALALRASLARAGHRVAAALVGQSAHRRLPAFFADRLGAPVQAFASPNFVPDARSRAVRKGATLMQTLAALPRYRHSLEVLGDAVDHFRPDVVVNFFEPLAGLFYGRYRPTVPMVSIAHQYLFLHPGYRFPRGARLERWALRQFTALTAWRARRRLALSLYEAPSVPGLTVMPPLLREEVLHCPRPPAEDFLLAYLLNPGYADELIAWHARHPALPLHCFWDHPGHPTPWAYDDTLTFHPLDDTHFLGRMARCRGLATTAGFESVAEARYLGRPVLMVPVAGHYEQRCNAHDATRAGIGLADTRFALERLPAVNPANDPATDGFRDWVAGAGTDFVTAIEAACLGTALAVNRAA